MSPGKLVDEKDVGCQDKSGPGKIHEVILVIIITPDLRLPMTKAHFDVFIHRL